MDDHHHDALGAGQPRILLVDDDASIVEPLTRALHRAGLAVWTADTGADVPTPMNVVPDLVILDLGLPDTDGLAICRRLRRDGHRGPILVLSGRSDSIDVAVAMDAGADDYVTKPFRSSLVIDRAWALLSGHPHPGPASGGRRWDTA